MADVFISYKSERRPAISHLARVIENYGYTVWFDYALMPGGSFSAQIERELRAARAVIVVWCSMSVRSVEGKTNWVVEEADLAKQLGTYLPVWLEPVDLPLGFRMGDVIDISEWNGDPRSHEIDRLIEQLTSKTQREPDIKYKALVAQSADVRRSGLTNLAAYPLDKQGAQLAARNREREQREKAEAEQIAENVRREAAAQLAAQQALADAQARVEAEQRLKQEQEAADALAKAEQERLAKLAEEERQQKALEEAAAKLREEQRLKDEAEAARKAEEARLKAEYLEQVRLEEQRQKDATDAAIIAKERRLEAERLERERLDEQRRQEEAERQRLAEEERKQEERRAARAAAREARRRAISERVGGATSALGAFVNDNRVPLVGLGTTVGVLSLVLTLASLGVGQEAIPEGEPSAVASGSEPTLAVAPTPSPATTPVATTKEGEWLVGEWVIDQTKTRNCSDKLHVETSDKDGFLRFIKPGKITEDYPITVLSKDSLETDDWRYSRQENGKIAMQLLDDPKVLLELSKCAK